MNGDPLLNHLEQILRSYRDEFPSEEKFAEEIEKAADHDGHMTRKKLRLLLGKDAEGRKLKSRDPAEISLSLSEIRALHAFLVSKDHGGFGALLEGRTLLGSVAAYGRLTFIIPSKPLSGSNAVILWDLLALVEILTALRKFGRNIDIEIDVIPSTKGMNRDELFSHIEEKKWESQPRSLICIGSPRANFASEFLLSQMYNCEPFSATIEHELPFRFYWKETSPLMSSFAASSHDLRERIPDWASVKNEALLSALLVRRGTTWEGYSMAHAGMQAWTTYGIVAAQRRDTGQIWIVAAGLEGPASLAAAKELARLNPPPVVPAIGKFGAKVGHPATYQYLIEWKAEKKARTRFKDQDPRELAERIRVSEVK